MAGQTAFPGIKYLDRVLRVVVPGVEEHVAKAGSYNSAYAHIQQQCAQPALRRAFVAEHTGYYVEADPEANGKHEAVPAYGHRP